MIRISTRGRYALRAIVDLAQHAGSEPVSRQEIADCQDISADYVAQLFRPLEKAGLVEGVKGRGGGYRLARDPALIRAGDVVLALKGPVAVAQCLLSCEDQHPSCRRIESCPTRPLCQRLSAAVTDTLNAVTRVDLCGEKLPPSRRPDQRRASFRLASSRYTPRQCRRPARVATRVPTRSRAAREQPGGDI